MFRCEREGDDCCFCRGYDDSPFDALGNEVSNSDQKDHFAGSINGQLWRSFLNFELPAVNPSFIAGATLRIYYADSSQDTPGT
jgi:hypothetical protein